MVQWTKEHWFKYFERHNNKLSNITLNDITWFILGWMVGIAMSIALGVL